MTQEYCAVGRRKTATARIRIKKGTGVFIINGKKMEDYLTRPALRAILYEPMSATTTLNEYDVVCNVKGSGLSGQAGAIRHGLSRALDKANPVLHSILKQHKMLTRDKRVVERKKYGHKKARKSFQFSKR